MWISRKKQIGSREKKRVKGGKFSQSNALWRGNWGGRQKKRKKPDTWELWAAPGKDPYVKWGGKQNEPIKEPNQVRTINQQ